MRKKGRKRKLGLALLGLAIFTLLAAFGVSNLFLLSPKGREFIERRIESRLRLESSVEGSTWSPWNGITIYGLRIGQPDGTSGPVATPLLSVQSIRLHPDWVALAGRRLEPKAIEILKPEITIPIELLSKIPRPEAKPAMAADAPDLASLEPLRGDNPETQNAPGSQPAATQTPNDMGLSEKAPDITTISAAEAPNPTVWVNVREGRVTIKSQMSPTPLLKAMGINGSIPLGGKSAASLIHVTKIKGFGGLPATEFTLPLKWSKLVLTTGIIGGEVAGLEYKVEGNIGLVPGLPFRIDALVPEQKESEFRFGSEIRAKTGTVMSQARLNGYLEIPSTWQGQCVAQATGVHASVGGRESRFDSGRALILFQNGTIRCLDARLLGEESSIIGNAMILADARIAANTRIVASPETLVEISRLTRSDRKTPQLTPLSTPQRAALDLQLFGHLGDIYYKPDPFAEAMPLH